MVLQFLQSLNFFSFLFPCLFLFQNYQQNRDFRKPLGSFTQSIFIPKTNNAISCTVDGDLVLWGPRDGDEKTIDKQAIKAIRFIIQNSFLSFFLNYFFRLSETAIRFITHTEKFIVTGTEDGCVRFYDFKVYIMIIISL